MNQALFVHVIIKKEKSFFTDEVWSVVGKEDR